jgi:Spy/CpxP family protein refolding chaperone
MRPQRSDPFQPTIDRKRTMKLTTKIIAGGAAALSLALAGAVYAHPEGGGNWGWGMGPGPGWGMGPGMGYGPGMGHGMGHGWGMGPGTGHMGYGMRGWAGGSDMAAVAAGRAAELKVLLKITPAQETAWKAYETALTQQATTMQALRTKMYEMHNSTPGSAEWAAQRDAMIKQHDGSWAAQAAAVKDLYAVLTPEQRVIADRSPMGFGGPRAGRGFPGR